MRTFHHTCGSCGTWLDTPLTDASVNVACPQCAAAIELEVFPALFRPAGPGLKGEDALTAEQSTCFYHPAKKAVVACASCGRFLCSLCDVDFGGRRMCPQCIESGAAKGKIASLRNETTYYDYIAMTVAIVGMVIVYISFITAPAAVYLTVRHWNTPLSAVPRTRARFGAAIVFALISLAMAAAIIVAIVTGT
jgi:hypothetical protein